MKKGFFALMLGTIFYPILPIWAMEDELKTTFTSKKEASHSRIFKFSEESSSETEDESLTKSQEQDGEEIGLQIQPPEQYNNQQIKMGNEEMVSQPLEKKDFTSFTIKERKSLPIEYFFEYKK